MSRIQGPAIFLAQFVCAAAPFNTLDGLASWAAGHGYDGVQMPTTVSPVNLDLGLRLLRLGGAGMGVLRQAPGAGRS